DFIYASTNARFALTEVTLGIMPGAGGTQNLPRAVGERRAKELILSGLPFSAEEAERWGLVNRVLPPEELLPATLVIADRIAGNGPVSVRQAKQAIHSGLQMSLADGLAFEIEAYNRLIPTDDRREGVAAFNGERKPKFEGKSALVETSRRADERRPVTSAECPSQRRRRVQKSLHLR